MQGFLTIFILSLFVSGCSGPDVYKVFLVGDSTMSDKTADAYPETGWRQVFPEFFDSAKVEFENHAKNGRSSKSFIYEGRWDSLLGRITPGSYVFIQFGHNDESPCKGERYSTLPEFKNNLRKYVTDVRAMEAFPILMTPVVRMKFNENGELVLTHGKYPDATIEIAEELHVPLIDHRTLSAELVSQKGDSLSRDLYLRVEKGHPNYPDGKQDDTHFSPDGARELARLVVDAIREKNLPLANIIKE